MSGCLIVCCLLSAFVFSSLEQNNSCLCEVMTSVADNLLNLTCLPQSFTYNYSDCDVSIVDKSDLNYELFFREYMVKNLPCVVKNVSNSWECTGKWSSHNSINYDRIENVYKDLIAPVADCNSISFNSQCKVDMTLGDYIKYLKKSDRDKLLYLKDWHLRRARPNDNFYEVPLFFASDWLNEYAEDKEEDDFMFVYIGPKDSWYEPKWVGKYLLQRLIIWVGY